MTQKSREQARIWLQSIAVQDSLDGINAQLCLNVMDADREQIQKLRDTVGSLFARSKAAMPKKTWEQIRMEIDGITRESQSI